MKVVPQVASVICCLALPCGLPPLRQHQQEEHAPEVSLCDLLERARPGDKLPATVKVIYWSSFENQTLSDPRHLLCRLDVAPTTEAQFARSARVAEVLLKTLRKDFRVYMTVRGVLWGPPPLEADEPSLPQIMAYARRIPARYGHLNSSRTLFVIDEVINWSRVPPGVPSTNEMPKPRPVSAIPEVVAAAVQGYPWRAFHTLTTGTVVVEVKLKKGKVMETKVASGDRLLVPSVVENIKTWSFKDQVDATFVTTYSFSLELRETGSDRNPRVELHLPLSAKITAPIDAW